MEKLLNAIASRLNVRIVVEKYWKNEHNAGLAVTMQMFEHRKVTDEVRELFKKELNSHLFTKLQQMEAGECVEYSFDYGELRPLGILMEDANDNLAEVLLKLPNLKEGESYYFPCDTYIRFTIIKKDAETALVMPDKICQWIMEAYSK